MNVLSDVSVISVLRVMSVVDVINGEESPPPPGTQINIDLSVICVMSVISAVMCYQRDSLMRVWSGSIV